MLILRSLLLFGLAGLCEIGGGYMFWLWLRDDRSPWLVFPGSVILILYGIVATFQPAKADFGRVYAAYGGVFIVMSLLWGGTIDHQRPDPYDLFGAALCLLGVIVMMFWPR